VTEGKRTLVAIHALRTSRQKQRLLEILSAHTMDPALLAEAVEIMDRAGSLEFARTYARDLVVDAKQGLVDVLPKSRARDLLVSMADFFVVRST
jgi:geranylgeranyl diphosphate synthase type I